MIGLAWDTDGKRDAIKQTAAGEALGFGAGAAFDLGLPLGDLGDFGDRLGSRVTTTLPTFRYP